MTSYDRQSLEAAIATDVSSGLRFEIHEGDLAYTLGLTLGEMSRPNVQAAMRGFLAANNIEVERGSEPTNYVFSRSSED